jgi:putative MATE family efflux protein
VPQKAILIEGPVGRTLIGLTGPMMVGFLAIMAFNVADTYFVAQLGTAELAAMGFIFPVIMIIAGVAVGLGTGTAAATSRAIGKGDQHDARRLATDSLVLSVVTVAVLAAVGLATIDPLFRLLGATPDLLPLIRQYMTIWYVGMVFLVVPMVGNSAIRASGDTTTPSLIMVIGAALNILLDPLLIFGLCGFPRLEMAGAAWATLLSRAATLAAALWILHFRKRMLDFSLPRLSEMASSWKKVLYIGLPAVGVNLLHPAAMGVLTRILAPYGAAAVAGFGTGVRVEGMLMVTLIALSVSLVPFIGQNWGARKFDRVHRAQTLSSWFSLFWGLFSWAVLASAGGRVARLFSGDPEVIGVIVSFLYIVPIGYGMRGICVIVSSVFNGINRPFDAALVSVVRLICLNIPLAVILSRSFGVKGLFAGLVAGNITAGILALLWAGRVRRRDESRLQGAGGSNPPEGAIEIVETEGVGTL